MDSGCVICSIRDGVPGTTETHLLHTFLTPLLHSEFLYCTLFIGLTHSLAPFSFPRVFTLKRYQSNSLCPYFSLTHFLSLTHSFFLPLMPLLDVHLHYTAPAPLRHGMCASPSNYRTFSRTDIIISCSWIEHTDLWNQLLCGA